MKPVLILGAGPAGASAAIAARMEGAPVTLIERSRFPRHKVCGEFFSPEIAPALERLGVWQEFLAAGAARVRRMVLNFGAREKVAKLPECAYGLSRYQFDWMLARASLGGCPEAGRQAGPTVIATGRTVTAARRGGRLFGFKAHFEGPADDAVELYFFSGCYVGVSAIEGGRTNVCGLGPEGFLRARGFDYDAVVQESPALRGRMAPLRRAMDWLSVGPLEFRNAFRDARDVYRAGDALSFIDPFTGSGLLAAVKTGRLAGIAAARATPVEVYLRECRQSLEKPFEVASLFRKVVARDWAKYAVGLAPARLLFQLTRPE